MPDLWENLEQPIDPNFDYFSALVGDGKKYKDQVSAGRAIVEKERHIAKIEAENAALRNDVKTRTSMEAFLDKLNSSQHVPPKENEETPPLTPPAEHTNIKTNGLSREEVLALVKEQEAQKQKELNTAKAVEGLKSAFGANYVQVLEQKALELGVSKDFLTSMAQTSPDGLLKVVGAVNAPKPQNTLPNGGMRTIPDVGTQGKKYADFQKLRKEKGDRYYWSASVQAELHREAEKQGEAFYS